MMPLHLVAKNTKQKETDLIRQIMTGKVCFAFVVSVMNKEGEGGVTAFAVRERSVCPVKSVISSSSPRKASR